LTAIRTPRPSSGSRWPALPSRLAKGKL
jgi:hypothetical protein